MEKEDGSGFKKLSLVIGVAWILFNYSFRFWPGSNLVFNIALSPYFVGIPIVAFVLFIIGAVKGRYEKASAGAPTTSHSKRNYWIGIGAFIIALLILPLLVNQIQYYQKPGWNLVGFEIVSYIMPYLVAIILLAVIGLSFTIRGMTQNNEPQEKIPLAKPTHRGIGIIELLLGGVLIYTLWSVSLALFFPGAISFAFSQGSVVIIIFEEIIALLYGLTLFIFGIRDLMR